MKRYWHISLCLLAALLPLLLLGGCQTLDGELPKGPDGLDGASAFDVWKEAVADGSIPWDKSQTTLADFFTYLKGEKGERGEGAFAMWQKMIATGNVSDPHNASATWPTNQNTEADFFNFISGKRGESPSIDPVTGFWKIKGQLTSIPARAANGQSAYELWKEKVKKGDLKWDKEKTTQSDFYLFLKGESGSTPTLSSNGTWVIGGKDTGVKAQGDSAYDLWKKEVEKGAVKDADGQPWEKTKNSPEDFYSFLKGKDGIDGQSTYDMWKAQAEKGELMNPQKPEEKWSEKETTMTDFYRFLTGADGPEGLKGDKGDKGAVGDKGKAGEDGANGTDGKDGDSAYEVWKKDLAENCGNEKTQLVNGFTGDVWPCEANTPEDFYKFLHTRLGAYGSDGKPGTPGKYGSEVRVVNGKPNVIAQYYDQEHSEYISPKTGKIIYTVYKKDGSLAPKGTKVTKMPGLPDETFTTDEHGQFSIENKKLPDFTHELDGWGTAMVQYPTESAPEESAKNTYVPDKIRVGARYHRADRNTKEVYETGDFNYVFQVTFQRSLRDKVESYPEWFENLRDPYVESVIVKDPKKYNSVTDEPTDNYTPLDDNVPKHKYCSNHGGVCSVYRKTVSIHRSHNTTKIQDGKRYYVSGYYAQLLKFNKDGKRVWPGTAEDKPKEYKTFYFTYKFTEGDFYGEPALWTNTIIQDLPTQAGPFLKKLTLIDRKDIDGIPSFSKVIAEIDYSRIDPTQILSSRRFNISTNEDGSTLIELNVYPEEEAKKVKRVYVTSHYTENGKNIFIATNNEPSSIENPICVLHNVPLGSILKISNYFKFYGEPDELDSVNGDQFEGWEHLGSINEIKDKETGQGTGEYTIGGDKKLVVYKENESDPDPDPKP